MFYRKKKTEGRTLARGLLEFVCRKNGWLNVMDIEKNIQWSRLEVWETVFFSRFSLCGAREQSVFGLREKKPRFASSRSVLAFGTVFTVVPGLHGMGINRYIAKIRHPFLQTPGRCRNVLASRAHPCCGAFM